MRRLSGIALVLLAACQLSAGRLPAEESSSTDAIARLLEQAAEAEFHGDYGKAHNFYKKATKLSPSSAEPWAAYGEHLRFYAHDEKAAAEAFNKALSAPETNARATAFAWRGLGELAAKTGDTEKAIDLFQKSLAAQPLADTHRSLCHLYCRQKDYKAAAEHAGKAVRLNPDDAIAILLYAAQLHRAGEKAEGFKQFEKALSLTGLNASGESKDPVHCCVYYNAAGYLAVTEDSKGALAMLKKFFKTPNHRHLTREEIEADTDFESLLTHPEFQKLLKSHL